MTNTLRARTARLGRASLEATGSRLAGRWGGGVIAVVSSGAEVYTEGVDGAFGGRLAFLVEGEGESGPADTRTTGVRVHDAVSSARAEADARREKLLAE